MLILILVNSKLYILGNTEYYLTFVIKTGNHVRYNKVWRSPKLKKELCGKSVRSWCDGSSDQSFMLDSLSYFSFQPVLHDW